MNCPKCDAKLNVIDSRAFSNNTTKRRHECPDCGERFTTIEKIMSKEEVNSVAKADVKSTKPSVDVDKIFETIAKNAIVQNGYMSAITGGIYETEEHALKDTIAELKRLCSQQF